MEENFSQFEPSTELLGKVFNRIKHEQKKARVKTFALFSVGILSSVFIFIPALLSTISEIQQSGLAGVISLIFSDFQAVISVWDDFLLSLLETLPIIRLAILFVAVYIFLRSIKYFVKSISSEKSILQTVKQQ